MIRQVSALSAIIETNLRPTLSLESAHQRDLQ